MSGSSYNVAMGRNDLAAIRAREECASYVGQVKEGRGAWR